MPIFKDIKKTQILLLVILAVAAIVRYWGIDFGLPHTQCRPDEEFVTNIIFSPARSFHPGSFNYPSFYKYLVLFFYGCYFVFGTITGKYTSMTGFFADYYYNPTNFYLIDRCLAALLGTLTVAIVYKLARQLFDKKTAIVSALFLCLAYLHVRDSHFGCVDVPQTFFIMCSILFMSRSYKDKTVKSYMLAGLLAGLATSTKYAGIILMAPMFVVHDFNVLSEKGKKYRLFLDKRILLFMSALAGAFFVGSPYCLIDWSHFMSDFMFEMRHLGGGNFVMLGIGWWYHLRVSLFYGLGWPILFMGIAGILYLMKTNIKKGLILCSFPLIYYVSAGKGYTVFLRYMDPVIPFLCITAAVFAIFITDSLTRGIRPGIRNVLTFFLALLMLYPSVRNVIQFSSLIARRDNRLIATEWVYENLPAEISVYQPGLFWEQLQLHPLAGPCKSGYKQILVTANRNGKKFRVKIDCHQTRGLPRYRLWEYYNDIGMFHSAGKLAYGLPDYIILEESPLSVWSPPPPKSIQELLENSYHIEKSFKVVDCANKDNLYDQQDAFYVPFVGFKDVERPGPNIYVFEKNQFSHLRSVP